MPVKNNMENGRRNIGAKTSKALGYGGGRWKMDYFKIFKA